MSANPITIKRGRGFFGLLAAAVFCAASPVAAKKPDISPFRGEKVVFCSDGEFDWHSGQSLYDFVILSRADGRFLISYLGIPHPSFEERVFDNAWIKMKGRFSSERVTTGKQSPAGVYRLNLALENQAPRVGTLSINETGKYNFTVEPPLAMEYVTPAGLCWDSLSEEPQEIKDKMRRRR